MGISGYWNGVYISYGEGLIFYLEHTDIYMNIIKSSRALTRSFQMYLDLTNQKLDQTKGCTDVGSFAFFKRSIACWCMSVLAWPLKLEVHRFPVLETWGTQVSFGIKEGRTKVSVAPDLVSKPSTHTTFHLASWNLSAASFSNLVLVLSIWSFSSFNFSPVATVLPFS